MNAPSVKKAKPATANSELALAAQSLFEGKTNFLKMRSGKNAVFKEATMESLPVIIGFFQTVVENIDPATIISLIDLYAERMEEMRKAKADSAYSPVILSTDELVQKMGGGGSMFMKLLVAAATQMPTLVATMSTLTEDEYKKLKPDEGMVVAAAIFMLNYGFFSQSLPPVILAFVRNIASRFPQNQPEAGKQAGPLVRRRPK